MVLRRCDLCKVKGAVDENHRIPDDDQGMQEACMRGPVIWVGTVVTH